MIQYKTNAGPWSLFLSFPNIILRYHGSILPNIVPQIVLSMVCSVLAMFFSIDVASNGHGLIAAPLAFLLVFKSYLSYAQYWEATAYIRPQSNDDGELRAEAVSREEIDEANRLKSRFIRLIKFYYFVVIEHLRVAGPGSVKRSDASWQRHKRQVDKLCASKLEMELLELATLGTRTTGGEFSQIKPLIILGWLAEAMDEAFDAGMLGPLRLAAMDKNLNSMLMSFRQIDKIDKMLFPFPFCQLVKLFELLYVFTLPFAIHPTMGDVGTFVTSLLVCVGVYGIDEVSEVLEDPFGDDSNDLPLDSMGRGLVRDLDLFFASDMVFHKTTSAGIDAGDENAAARLQQLVKRDKDGLVLPRMSSLREDAFEVPADVEPQQAS